MNIFQKISLHHKVNKIFRSYFKEKEKHMAFLEYVENDLNEDIVSIYHLIKEQAPKKYKKDIARYESVLGKILEHNKEVKYIVSTIDSWNFNSVLEEIDKYDESKSKEYANVAGLLTKYKKLDEKYILFCKDLIVLNTKYDKIAKEYITYKKYKDLLDISNYGYINVKQKKEIIKTIESFVAGIKINSFVFYEFNKHQNMEELIANHNSNYLHQLSKNSLFDDINGKSLDEEQRKAVLLDDDAVLVVAGAGSGKTLTICGKVEYLLNEEGVGPTEILLLSYSKKSADDLQTKISKIDKNLKVGTFHKIGLDILKETQNKTFMVEDQYKAIIEAYFREEMQRRPKMLQTILMYYSFFISDTKHDKKYKQEGDLYEFLKKADFQTLKYQLLSLSEDVVQRETIKKEFVKSFQEMAIANWYFINGIDYIYEAPYEYDVSTWDKRQYMPDFKLKEYNIYHEHYGVDKDGTASQFSGDEAYKYIEGMKWKRNIHDLNKTDCIETFSYEFEDGTIFNKLEKELKKRGVEFHPLTDEEIYSALKSVYEGKQFKSLINLMSTFLSLYKSTYRDDSGFEKLKETPFKSKYEKSRASLFLDIVKDIYHYYIDYLKKEGKIDFDDMILQSTLELDNTNNYKYKYIIVDEFQDISVSRMKFLKRLIQQGNSKLFAVGDDWQAIYRFSGCDLNIFLEFEKYFGDAAIAKITTTHRNSQELQDIAGPFIKKNPEQFDKKINSARHLEHPVQIMYYTDAKYYAFLDVLRTISKIDKKANVLVLGRNNKDFEDIALDERIYIDYRNSDETKTIIRCSYFPEMTLTYSTVHGSKGLEEDYVILINADDSRIGFPNKMEDDDLLDLVLSHKSEYEYAEERRLWYVALTRTRNYTYIIANANSPSIFLKEIEDQCVVINKEFDPNENKSTIACPKCRSGRLVLRVNSVDDTKFFGCSNYPYCNYSIDDIRAVKRNMRCPICGDFMVYKTGRYGAFYGCYNYPRCNHKEKYEPNN